MLNVFITVDTEIWPDAWNVSSAGIRRAMVRDIYGRTAKGDYGIPFQLNLLAEHGLASTFFVESLFADVVGDAPLREITELISNAGQELQLHLHPEWVPFLADPSSLVSRGCNVADFTGAEQLHLIERSADRFRAATGRAPLAFRAGNYGADNATLRALARLGIRFDTSYNLPYLESDCAIQLDRPAMQPVRLEGLHEIPITYFEDFPGHFRHAQLCACSADEMTGMLMQAWERNWFSFVIVSHSFELLNERRTGPDRYVVKRFERLCRFLAEHTDKFRTRRFDDVDENELPHVTVDQPLRSGALRTARRMGEQLARRVA